MRAPWQQHDSHTSTCIVRLFKLSQFTTFCPLCRYALNYIFLGVICFLFRPSFNSTRFAYSELEGACSTRASLDAPDPQMILPVSFAQEECSSQADESGLESNASREVEEKPICASST